ncbi:hypothetical protein K440DRAFT_71046 [Wilcoxina mikolae CBS 423.85]|nr:hypothetical protein K440DRAFT_71046 [Wilcoxina mikolae CBS 423.85]
MGWNIIALRIGISAVCMSASENPIKSLPTFSHTYKHNSLVVEGNNVVVCDVLVIDSSILNWLQMEMRGWLAFAAGTIGRQELFQPPRKGGPQ